MASNVRALFILLLVVDALFVSLVVYPNSPSIWTRDIIRNEKPSSNLISRDPYIHFDEIMTSRQIMFDSRPADSITEVTIPVPKIWWARSVKQVNCAKIIAGNGKEITKASTIMSSRPKYKTGRYFLTASLERNCRVYKDTRGYIIGPGAPEEERFPLAYSLIVYRDFPRVERLLRAVYRPQNIYCIHVDAKSRQILKDAIRKLASCFDNVFLASRNVNVQWGEFSVLEAELICMKNLIMKNQTWKYFINLTGQEFPLKTNWQIVKILKSYRGANDIPGTVNERYQSRTIGAGPVPHNITLTKGTVHMVASRAFVEFVFENETARDFLNWTTKTNVPDETFFSTLQYNSQLGVPGAISNPQYVMETHRSMTRYKLWRPMMCGGIWHRGICIFNVRDLQRMTSSDKLFANKFFPRYGQLAYDCLEEWHWNRTRDEYAGVYVFNATKYEDLPHVQYRTNVIKSEDELSRTNT